MLTLSLLSLIGVVVLVDVVTTGRHRTLPLTQPPRH